ncbi:MAG TPA: sigma-70 family RNA polymerase sigma factor [Planctomycetota bacterium]|nr:sigma-70 family RNA polymerase sigma factor [Planctomycetota bacterium]
MATSREEWVQGALGRYEAPLMRYAARLLDDPELARDVVQDCFVRLCQQRPEALDGHLGEWLFTVCRRRAIDHLRRKGRMHRLDDVEPAVRMEDAVERREEEATLMERIARLPKMQQEVLLLKFQEGLSYKQISAITMTSVGNVGYLLHHALRTLRSELAPGRSQS